MKYIDKAKSEGHVINKHGIPLRCPRDYGYEETNTECRKMSCTECWNRKKAT